MNETILSLPFRGLVTETKARFSTKAENAALGGPTSRHFEALLKQHAIEKGNRVCLPLEHPFSTNASDHDVAHEYSDYHTTLLASSWGDGEEHRQSHALVRRYAQSHLN